MPPSQYIENGKMIWDYAALRELFDHPEQWTETRSRVDVLGVVPWIVMAHFKDEELKAYAKQIESWGLKVGLECGAVKPHTPTGKGCYLVVKSQIDRLVSCGWKIYALAMDEPLQACRYDIKKPDSFTVDEVSEFIRLTRGSYPDLQIGDIEPWSGGVKSTADDMLGYVDALQEKLKSLDVRGIDFFRLDLNPLPGNGVSWVEVKKLEEGLRKRKIPFSLIYIGLHQDFLRPYNLMDDYISFEGIMARYYQYAALGGSPDQYCIQEWSLVPRHAVPENEEWTFSHTALEFLRRFLPDHIRK